MNLLARQYALCQCGHFAHGHKGLAGRCQFRQALAGSPTCYCQAFEGAVT
jgi:hypothetical protein